METTN